MAKTKTKATLTVDARVASNLAATLKKRRDEVQYKLWKNKSEIKRLADEQGKLKTELSALHQIVASLEPKASV